MLILDDWQILVNIFALSRLHSGIQVFDSLIFINIFALSHLHSGIQVFDSLIFINTFCFGLHCCLHSGIQVLDSLIFYQHFATFLTPTPPVTPIRQYTHDVMIRTIRAYDSGWLADFGKHFCSQSSRFVGFYRHFCFGLHCCLHSDMQVFDPQIFIDIFALGRTVVSIQA